jgi:hypothetical protein
MTGAGDGEHDQVPEWWRDKAAGLSAELGFEILWCPLGFEVPRADGGITHVSSPDAVRTILGWTAPGILEALIPGRMRSHACTAEVP